MAKKYCATCGDRLYNKHLKRGLAIEIDGKYYHTKKKLSKIERDKLGVFEVSCVPEEYEDRVSVGHLTPEDKKCIVAHYKFKCVLYNLFYLIENADYFNYDKATLQGFKEITKDMLKKLERKDGGTNPKNMGLIKHEYDEQPLKENREESENE